MPSNINQGVDWVEPYDRTYLPFDRCGEVKDIEVTKLEESVISYMERKSWWGSLEHYRRLVSVIKVTYRVTCENKLKYEGITYLFSEPHGINNIWCWQHESDCEEFKKHAHDEWYEKPLDYLSDAGVYYDKIAPEFENYGRFDKDVIKTYWSNQKVFFPEWKYTGIPGKSLAHPILFVHGLGSDFETWGVEAIADKGKDGINKGNADFQNGLVKKYIKGSAPDILARTMNVDNSEENINKNGMYFFQAPGGVIGGKWVEAKPLWDANNVQKSQSRKLYEQIKNILDDFYGAKGIDWKKIDDTPIDFVAHSQGGLVIREMLRGLQTDAASFPSGLANPANHIGKVVTVDTPHFGSELAIENTESIASEFPGLKMIIDDLDAQTKGEPNEHTLIEATLNMGLFDYANQAGSILIDGMTDVLNTGGPLDMLNIFAPFAYVLGWSYGAASWATTDVNLLIKGPYIGKYTAYTEIDGPLFMNFDGPKFEIDTLEQISEKLRDIRNGAMYLGRDNPFMERLTRGYNGQGAYPRKPDGRNISLLPLYSPKTKRLLSQLLYAVAEGADRLCADKDDDSDGCFVIGPLFKSKAVEMANKKDMDINDVSDIKISGDLWNALVSIQDTWFEKSDALVTETSQKFIDKELGLDPALINEFSNPRRFLFHDALASWEDVLHMRIDVMKGKVLNEGATRQGLDIACALDRYCNFVAENESARIMYLNYGSISFAGDFDVAPIYLNQGSQEVQISDGTNYLRASYIPELGSVVHYTDETGKEIEDIVYDSFVATIPAISRKGQVIHVAFNNQSGRSFTKDYAISKLSNVATYSILSNDAVNYSKIVMGVGVASDPSTQAPPEMPKNELFAKSSIFAYHREARGKEEYNTSRPRILVGNTSDKNIHGFKVAYYFTADPAHTPVVEIDYPKIPFVLENLGGDQWRFVLDASDSVLKAKSICPNVDGWQIRIHYNDWAKYSYRNDWSANYNIGRPMVNTKIVIYDKNGGILWGQEPEKLQSQKTGVVPLAMASMAWYDSAPWEKNTLKPRVSIQNTGSVPLQNFYAKLWFRVPEGKRLYVPFDEWYTPVSDPSLQNVKDNVWELKLFFNKYILYPGDSIQEGDIGLHLIDWSTFDKTVCGIALIDSENNIIFGSEPSVEECKSFAQPTLMHSLYAWSF